VSETFECRVGVGIQQQSVDILLYFINSHCSRCSCFYIFVRGFQCNYHVGILGAYFHWITIEEDFQGHC